MLILSRKFNESFIIDGRIVVKVVRLDSDVVKLGIEAPMDVPVHRQEIFDEIRRNNRESMMATRLPVPRLSGAYYAPTTPVVPCVEKAPEPAKPDEPSAPPKKIKASSKSTVKNGAAATTKTTTRKTTRVKSAA